MPRLPQSYTIAFSITLLVPTHGLAAGFVQSPAYIECSKLSTTSPSTALAKADEWLKIDDSYSAHHCRAMALFGMQRFTDAADALELVRDKIPENDLTLQTYVTKQAATAWESAGRSAAALTTIGQQLTAMGKRKGANALVSKLSSDLLVARAQIRIHYGQRDEAMRDLDHAVSLTPINTDVLLARADLFQQLGDTALATNDAQAVLTLDPKNEKAKALIAKLTATPTPEKAIP
ncbi:MAG: hypothetical protein B7X02_00720 [Rhodospirillales bacterium 12-54-5]|nr:MAG: hypothetical protein B7X02_00720 [Rhodospirillales bacterium 12-54-5]